MLIDSTNRFFWPSRSQLHDEIDRDSGRGQTGHHLPRGGALRTDAGRSGEPPTVSRPLPQSTSYKRLSNRPPHLLLNLLFDLLLDLLLNRLLNLLLDLLLSPPLHLFLDFLVNLIFDLLFTLFPSHMGRSTCKLTSKLTIKSSSSSIFYVIRSQLVKSTCKSTS